MPCVNKLTALVCLFSVLVPFEEDFDPELQ